MELIKLWSRARLPEWVLKAVVLHDDRLKRQASGTSQDGFLSGEARRSQGKFPRKAQSLVPHHNGGFEVGSRAYDKLSVSITSTARSTITPEGGP